LLIPSEREIRHDLPFSDQSPSRREIEQRQLDMLNSTLERAFANSAFYRGHLPKHHLDSLEELQEFPFMSEQDLAGSGKSMLAIPAHKVARVVTLATSGTQGSPKRIAFTHDDLDRTVMFFTSGLQCIARPGETTAVLFPCDTPDGLGDLICRALENIRAMALPYGTPSRLASAARALEKGGATSIVGSTQETMALAKWCNVRDRSSAIGQPGRSELPDLGLRRLGIKRVLLSSDNICCSAVEAIENSWGCEVFEHYGMTEVGYGCAVDCHAHNGMHIREGNILVEIVDPETLRPVPDGELGEVVVTTLSNEAMPLIRYRTGDISRIIPGTCRCGGTLKRLDRVRGHALSENPWDWKTASELDERMFRLPGVVDYRATLLDAKTAKIHVVTLLSLKEESVRVVAEEVLGVAVEIDAEIVDDIESPLVGKRPRLR
jgi:phenylacetate-CoA ligase